MSPRDQYLEILRRNPQDRKARLLLAKSYYHDQLTEFAIRELLEIRRYGTTPSVEKLIESFGALVVPYLSNQNQSPANYHIDENSKELAEETLGEMDLDSDFIDAIEDLEDNK
jgi:hypothetical protein